MTSRIALRELIMGKHAIEELLQEAPHRIRQLWTVRGKEEAPLVLACRKQRIPVTFLSLDALSQLVQSDSHQSFVAQITERVYLEMKSFLEHAASLDNMLVLMLDQIFDPQNFGAILRSAECFGVDAVLFSKNRGTDITPVVVKASAGASELVPLLPVSNLADAMGRLQKAGFEGVATLADHHSESLYQMQFSAKTLLILGSEGEGIQPLLRKRADRSCYIPLLGKIGSLNVAQAAAIFLSHIRVCLKIK